MLLGQRRGPEPRQLKDPSAPLVGSQRQSWAPEFPQLLFEKNFIEGTSLAVQWLRLCASAAGGVGLIPGRGTEILRAAQHGQKIKKERKRKKRKYKQKFY